MRERTLPDTDIRVSELCLGTMTWGEQNSEAEAHAQIDCALAHGVNFIDAAEMYPIPPGPRTMGRTETILGSWLGRAQRDRVIVATKVAGPGRRDWVRGGRTDLTRANIHEACDLSLKRLQTDYIDLYQIHWPQRNVPMFGTSRFDPSQENDKAHVPMLEQVQAMDALVRAGKIRAWGVSNETAWGVCEFTRLARENGLARPVTIQNSYNLVSRTFEYDLAEACFRENVGLLAYSPLAMGVLAGKYLGGARPPAARLTLFESFGERYRREGVARAAGEYAALAKRHGVRLADIAIAFVRSRWFTTATILGATSVEQLEQNLAAATVEFDADLLAGIEAIHARIPSPTAGL
jgi:aryl-alcohol dehydrogenase (NADP+)